MLANGAHRGMEVLHRGGFDGHCLTPDLDDRRSSECVDPRLSGDNVEKFSKRLERLNAILQPHRSLQQIGSPAVSLAGQSIGRIYQYVGVEADQRSCISSRVKRRLPI